MAKHVFAVFTNALEGRDKEFNDWYSDVHVPHVLDVPGIEAAQRFALSHTQRAEPPHPYRYLTLYDIETDDIQSVLAGFAERSGTPRMSVTEAIAPGSMSLFYQAIDPRVGLSADGSIKPTDAQPYEVP